MDQVSQKVWSNHGQGEISLASYKGTINVSKSNLQPTNFTVSVRWNFDSRCAYINVFCHSFVAGSNKWTMKIFGKGFCGACSYMSVGLCLAKCPSGIPQWVLMRNPHDNSYSEQEFKVGEIHGIARYKTQDSPPLIINFNIIEKYIKEVPDIEPFKRSDSEFLNIFSHNVMFEGDLTDILYTKDRDITIYGDDWEIKTHKDVLTTRSPVFAAMFNSSMRESQTNRINITDFDPDVIKALLNYMYSGKPSMGIDDILPKLYLASSKYQIDNLTLYCEQQLCKGITISNVFERVMVADLSQSDPISNACSRFLVDNYDQITKHGEWKKFEDKYKTMCMVVKLLKSLLK